MFIPRQFKRKKIFLTVFAAVLIISAAGLFGYKILTENKLSRFEIKVENLNCTNAAEIMSLLQSRNINYFYFKAGDLENDLRKKYFCIGKIESEVSYPDKLKLKITGRIGKFLVVSIQPAAEINPAIRLSLEQMSATQSTTEAFPPKVLNQILNTYRQASASAMYLADEEGMIFEEAASDTALPRLSIFSEELKIGQKIPGDYIKKTTQVLDKLNGSEVTADNLIIVGDKLIIDSKPRVTFALDKDINRQSASLQLILRQAKMNLAADTGDSRSIAEATNLFIESIDLRFDRPVVVYNKK